MHHRERACISLCHSSRVKQDGSTRTLGAPARAAMSASIVRLSWVPADTVGTKTAVWRAHHESDSVMRSTMAR